MGLFGLGRRQEVVSQPVAAKAVETVPPKEERAEVKTATVAPQNEGVPAEATLATTPENKDVVRAVANARLDLVVKRAKVQQRLEETSARELAEAAAAKVAQKEALIKSIPTDADLVKRLESLSHPHGFNYIDVLTIPIDFIDLDSTPVVQKDPHRDPYDTGYAFPTLNPSIAPVIEALCKKLEVYGLTVTGSPFESTQRRGNYVSFIIRGFLNSNEASPPENTFSWFLEQKAKAIEARAKVTADLN